MTAGGGGLTIYSALLVGIWILQAATVVNIRTRIPKSYAAGYSEGAMLNVLFRMDGTIANPGDLFASGSCVLPKMRRRFPLSGR